MAIRQLYLQQPPPDAPVATGSQILAKASQKLGKGRDEWFQGDFFDDEGEGSCALGAINQANKGFCVTTEDYNAAMSALLSALKEVYPTLTAETIPEINDDPQVTYEGVLLAFKNATTVMEEKESENA